MRTITTLALATATLVTPRAAMATECSPVVYDAAAQEIMDRVEGQLIEAGWDDWETHDAVVAELIAGYDAGGFSCQTAFDDGAMGWTIDATEVVVTEPDQCLALWTADHELVFPARDSGETVYETATRAQCEAMEKAAENLKEQFHALRVILKACETDPANDCSEFGEALAMTAILWTANHRDYTAGDCHLVLGRFLPSL